MLRIFCQYACEYRALLRTLLGDPVPALPHTVLPLPNPAMAESVRNVETSLARHWDIFSGRRGEKTTLREWRGPKEPARPPYDIMCPTPPRSSQEEEHFNKVVRDIVTRTDLSVPPLHTVRGDDLGDDQAVELVLRKEARLAVVTTLGLSLHLKTLLVELCRDVVLPTCSDLKKVKVCRCDDGSYTLTSDLSVTSDSSLCHLVTRRLLPLAYTHLPELVVVAAGHVPSQHLSFTLHQLQTLANGRMILIQS